MAKQKEKQTGKKNRNTKNELVEKTVKYYSNELTNDEIHDIEIVLNRGLSARNLFYSMFSGVHHYNDLGFFKLRDEIINNHREDIINVLNIPAREWKMQLTEVLGNIKSMWSNLKNDIKEHVRDNEHLIYEDKHFIFYVLKVDKLLAEVLETQTIKEKPDGLAKIKV